MFMSIVVAALPLTTMAQDDDMYFVPSKSKAKTVATETPRSSYTPVPDTYYPGSSRNVDEYNRRGSAYEVLPADTGDIISFAPVEGVYPDSLGDFQMTRKMSRWDGYEPSDAYLAGYKQGRNDATWHSPWYYSYYPWYDSWYWWDPWYYSSWHYGWYDPWYYSGWGWHGYYGYYSYYNPWYYDRWYWGGGGGVHVAHNSGHYGGNYHNLAHGAGGSRYGGGGVAGTRKTSRYGNTGGMATGSRTTGGTRVTSGNRTTYGTRTTTGTTGSRGVRSAISTYSGSSYSGGSYSSGSYSTPRSEGSRSSSYSGGGSSYTPSSSGSSVSSGSRSSGGSFGGSSSRGGGGGGGSRSGGSRR